MACEETPIIPFSSDETGILDLGDDTRASASERATPDDEQLHAAAGAGRGAGGGALLMRLSSFHSDDGERGCPQPPPRVAPDSAAPVPEPVSAASSPTDSDPERRPVERTAADAAAAQVATAPPKLTSAKDTRCAALCVRVRYTIGDEVRACVRTRPCAPSAAQYEGTSRRGLASDVE